MNNSARRFPRNTNVKGIYSGIYSIHGPSLKTNVGGGNKIALIANIESYLSENLKNSLVNYADNRDI